MELATVGSEVKPGLDRIRSVNMASPAALVVALSAAASGARLGDPAINAIQIGMQGKVYPVKVSIRFLRGNTVILGKQERIRIRALDASMYHDLRCCRMYLDLDPAA